MPSNEMVYIIDDDSSVREALSSLLRANGKLVQMFTSGQEFLNFQRHDSSACVILDLRMPGLNGLQATRTIRKANARVKVVIMTIQEDRDFVTAALSAGATGYVTKGRLSHDLVFALHEAMEGRMFVSNLGAI